MKHVRAIYPGTFDPLTNGHLDLIARGAKIFDELVVAILRNSEKSPLFTLEERTEMIADSTRQYRNVTVASFEGLLVDFAREQQASAVLRGIRAISDYEYEFQMALMNRHLSEGFETVFMVPSVETTYISSSVVREVAQHNGNLKALVHPAVAKALAKKFARNKPSSPAESAVQGPAKRG